MNSKKLLQLVCMLVETPPSESPEASQKEAKRYAKTPVFIHHESDEGGVCFSFMYNGETYRFQRVGSEVYGPFTVEDWEILQDEYKVQAELNWVNPVMYPDEFNEAPAVKSFYSPASKSVVKQIGREWYTLTDGEVERIEIEQPEPEKV